MMYYKNLLPTKGRYGYTVPSCLTFCFLMLLTVAPTAAYSQTQDISKPNILLILIDDAGFDDFSFQGSAEFSTPNIDSIAQGGVVFSNAYSSSSVCSPSRAGLLTGRYQHRFGMEKNLTRFPESLSRGIPADEYTLAQNLQAAGYRTGVIGKWHVGYAQSLQPKAKGFDYFYGLLGGARSYFEHKPEGNNKEQAFNFLQRNGETIAEQPARYLTDDLTDDAIRFLKRNQSTPFFLYLSYTAVHTPMHATDALLAKVPDTIAEPKRKILHAMTASLDINIGKINQALDAYGLSDNTLVVLLNDNGGATTNASSNGKLRGYKGSNFEGGIKVPFAIKWPGKLKAGSRFEHRVSALDVLPTLMAATQAPYLAGQKTLDGVNLLPYLRSDKAPAPHHSLFFKFWSGKAHIKGDWKWVAARISKVGEEKRMAEYLFDLSKDPYEQNNLANRFPQIKQALKQEWDNWDKQLIKL